MDKLKDLRGEIDEVDRAILALFEERMGIVRQIGKLKKEENLKIEDRVRQEEHAKELCAMAEDMEIPVAMVREIYEIIHKYSLQEEEK